MAKRLGPAFVYFIRSEEYVKIGATTYHPAYRVSELQVGNPIQLRLLFYIKCEMSSSAWSLEQRLHKDFQKHHVRGEWFMREPVEEWAIQASSAFGEDIIFENEQLKRMAKLMPNIDEEFYEEDIDE